ncbi:MAG: trimethylamine methyltransferase family protein [Desulfopila sp.]
MKYFEVLEQHELDAIHQNVLRILHEVGISFDYEPAIEVFKKNGFKVQGSVVYFDKNVVEELRKLPPSEFTLYGRTSKDDVVFNTDALITIPCYGSPFVSDLDLGRRNGTRKDFVNFTKLTQESPNLEHGQ